MKLIWIAVLLLASCSTLMSAGAAAAGGAVGSLAGPGGAAIGGAAGVVAVELMEEKSPVEPVPVDGPAATVHQVDNLIHSVGWWFLIIFVFVPLLTKKGRGWIKNLTDLHNNVSRKDIEKLEKELAELKK